MKWDVHVYDRRSQTTTTHVMDYPTTSRHEGAAVAIWAARDLKKPVGLILAVPHHEQTVKTKAQIKREIDEAIGARPRSSRRRG